MIRRCPAPLTAMVAALVFGLGSQPRSTRADGSSSATAGTAEYTLTTTTGLPARVSRSRYCRHASGTSRVDRPRSAYPSTSEFALGDPVSGSGIPSGTTIGEINGNTSVTLSQDATASGSPSLTFTPCRRRKSLRSSIPPAVLSRLRPPRRRARLFP